MSRETGPQIGTEVSPQHSVMDRVFLGLGRSHIGRVSIPIILALGVAGPVHGQEQPPQPSFVVTDQDGITQEYALGDSSLALTPVRGEAAALDTVGNPPAEAEMSADLPSAEVRSFQDIYELKWEDPSELGKDGKPMKRSFKFINPPAGNTGFTINFNREFQIEVRDESTNRVVSDPVTGQPKMRTTTVVDEIKRVMNKYRVGEFLAEPHSIDELTPTIINGETVYLNKLGFSIEQPYGSDNRIPLMKAEWWIKPDSNPNGIVNRYYLIDNQFPPIDEDNSVAFMRYFGTNLADTLYFYRSSPPNSEYIFNPENTPERSRLVGELTQRVRPVDLAPTPATLNNSSDIS